MSISQVDALSRLRFHKKSKDKMEEEFEDTFSHWVETDVLSLDRMAAETRHVPVLSRITSRIRKNMGKLLQGGETLQRNKTKVIIEHGVICNRDLIIPPETQRKLE